LRNRTKWGIFGTHCSLYIRSYEYEYVYSPKKAAQNTV